MSERIPGQVVAAHGRQYMVELAGGETLLCFPRGKKSDIACGDRVEISRPAKDQGAIEAITPRNSLLYRSNEYRQKLIAANVSQVLIVVATEPGFSFELVCRTLVATQDQGVAARIILNKCDLADKIAPARQALAPFVALGVPVLELSALHGAEALRPLLAGHTSLLVGQSGMGKSTLVNALIPEARAATREISEALDSGKHTTTHARLYDLDAETSLIDSPGLQEFGLHHLDATDLLHYFPDMRHLVGQCRFHNCSHRQEPGCAVKAAAENGSIRPERLAFLQKLTDDLSR